jgi:hypothetical protein
LNDVGWQKSGLPFIINLHRQNKKVEKAIRFEWGAMAIS